MKQISILVLVLPSLLFASSALAQVTEHGVNTPCSLPTCTSTIDFSVSGTISSASVRIDGGAGLSVYFTLAGPGISTPVVVGPVNGNFYMNVEDTAPQACSALCTSDCGSFATPVTCSPDSGTLGQTTGQLSDAQQWSLSLSSVPPLTGSTPEGSATMDAFGLTLDGSPPLPVELSNFSID